MRGDPGYRCCPTKIKKTQKLKNSILALLYIYILTSFSQRSHVTNICKILWLNEKIGIRGVAPMLTVGGGGAKVDRS